MIESPGSIDDDDDYRKSRDLAVVAQERARIVAWLRSHTQNRHAQEWADAIERRADMKGREIL
jgi:hypothetical protein